MPTHGSARTVVDRTLRTGRAPGKAFTLLELIVTLAVLGLLAAITIPTFKTVIENSRVRTTEASLGALAWNAKAQAAFTQSDPRGFLDEAAAEMGTDASEYLVKEAAGTVLSPDKLVLMTMAADGSVVFSDGRKDDDAPVFSEPPIVITDPAPEPGGSAGGSTPAPAPSTPAPTPAPAPSTPAPTPEPDGEDADTPGAVVVNPNLLTPSMATIASTSGFTVRRATVALETGTTRSDGNALKVTPLGTDSTNGFDASTSVGGDSRGGLRLGMVAGTTYTFSGYVYVPSGVPLTLATDGRHLSPIAYTLSASAPTNTTYRSTIGTKPNAHDTWQRVSVTFTIPADATEAFVRLQNSTNDASKPVYWDDLKLEEGSVATG